MTQIADEILHDKNASAIAKSLAAFILTPDAEMNEADTIMEEAIHVIRSNKYSARTKSLAASVLTLASQKRAMTDQKHAAFRRRDKNALVLVRA